MSIEKAIAAGLTPLVEEIVSLEKRIEQIERTPGPAGKDGKDADPNEICARLGNNDNFIRAIKGKDGADGKDGKDGKDAIAPTADDVAKAIVEQYDIKGEKGDAGADGKDGADGQPGADGQHGRDGVGIDVPVHVKGAVYRQHVVVQAHLGRFYAAKRDTATAPGEGDDWERIGTAGMRFVGQKEHASEPGDIYIDGGSGFLFDGEKGRMIVQRGEKGSRGEKGDKGDKGDAAPTVVGVEIQTDSAVLKMSDGRQVPFDIDGLKNLIAVCLVELMGDGSA